MAWRLLVPAATAVYLLIPARRIVILDLGDRRKRYLHYLPVRAFHLDAGSCESLSGFHAANDAPHALAIHRYNLNIIFSVQRLQGCEGFSYFHVSISSEVHTHFWANWTLLKF